MPVVFTVVVENPDSPGERMIINQEDYDLHPTHYKLWQEEEKPRRKKGSADGEE